MELLGHVVTPCLHSEEWTVFFKAAVPFYTPSVWVPISSYPYQYLLISVFLIIAIPGGMKWYFIVVLIYISPMTNDVEHLFMHLLSICISSLEKYLFKSLPILKLGCLYCWVAGVFKYILHTGLLSGIWFAKIFSHSVVLSFHFLNGVLWSTKFLILMIQSVYYFGHL